MSSELSEIQQERAELDSKYEGGLPSYLSDYFDKKEKAAIHDEFYRKNTKRIWSYSKEERREFAIEREENFWKNNKAEIIKSPLTTGKTVYEEPPKAELRVEEDKIEGVSNKLAAIACSHSLEAFGVRYFPHYMTKATSKFHKFLFKTLTRETHKKKGCKWAIAAPRGNAKCLDSNTFVQLYNGRVKKIKDVKVGDEVVCVNNELKLDKDVVSAVLNSGRKKVRRFTLSSGRNITMTDDHRLFDIHGEIEARDIKIGTKIATPRKLSCAAEDKYSISDDNDIFWEEVVDISDYFYTETYDIETQKYHNFVANDIVSHNSTIISAIFPLWCICYNKKKFIILISDTLGQAEDFLADIKRELETNLMIQQDFPFAFGKGEMWRSDEIITRNGVKVKALGTGSKIRGRRFGTTRPDLLLQDDLESSDMVRSDVQRKFIRNQWFNKDLLFAGREDGTTDFYVVGTILGKDSLLNNLLDPEQYPDWSSMRFKAVEEFSDSPLWEEWAKIYKDRFNANRKEDALKFFEEHKEEMLEGTKVLWPEGDPYYNLMVYKLSDPSGFLMEKQNAPVDLTKVLVTKEDLHFENFNMPKVREDLEHAVYYGAIDPSLGKHSTSGDYSAIVTVARSTKTGYIYVVNMDIKRRSVDTQIDDIIRSFLRYKHHSFAIETNAFQYVMADTLRKKARKFGVNIPIVEVNQYKDKKLRFEGIVPLIIDGTIVFDTVRSSTSNMYAEGIEQIVTFTGENDEHDDACDALQLSVDLAKAPRFRMIKRMAKNRRTRRV